MNEANFDGYFPAFDYAERVAIKIGLAELLDLYAQDRGRGYLKQVKR